MHDLGAVSCAAGAGGAVSPASIEDAGRWRDTGTAQGPGISAVIRAMRNIALGNSSSRHFYLHYSNLLVCVQGYVEEALEASGGADMHGQGMSSVWKTSFEDAKVGYCVWKYSLLTISFVDWIVGVGCRN